MINLCHFENVALCTLETLASKLNVVYKLIIIQFSLEDHFNYISALLNENFKQITWNIPWDFHLLYAGFIVAHYAAASKWSCKKMHCKFAVHVLSLSLGTFYIYLGIYVYWLDHLCCIPYRILLLIKVSQQEYSSFDTATWLVAFCFFGFSLLLRSLPTYRTIECCSSSSIKTLFSRALSRSWCLL